MAAETDPYQLVLVLHDDELDSDALCAVLAARVGRGGARWRFVSRVVNREGAWTVGEALRSDGVLWITAAPGASASLLTFVAEWRSLRINRQLPNRLFGQSLPRGLAGADVSGCSVVLVLPFNHGCHQENEAGWNDIRDTAQFVYWTHALPAHAPDEWKPQAIGYADPLPTHRDLCLLHHRDSADARAHASLHEAFLESSRPLTWSDLQLALRSQPDAKMLAILTDLAAEDRLDAQQLGYAHRALDMLRDARDRTALDRHGSSVIWPDIHHLLWYTGVCTEANDVCFRGQASCQWELVPTLLRPDAYGTQPSLRTLDDRITLTETFVERLAEHEVEWFGHSLDEDQRLAIAQHHGLPTTLIDYTTSLEVAAFFATGAGKPPVAGGVGVIHMLRIGERWTGAEDEADEADDRLDFRRLAGVREGRLRVIQPPLTGPEDRIGRQRGWFIDGFESRALHRAVSTSLYFRQQPGVAYEDALRGITRAALLDERTRLHELASNIGKESAPLSRPAVSRLRSIRWPDQELFGSIGRLQGVNLSKGQRALDRLREKVLGVAPDRWPSLHAILGRHFQMARASARTDESAIPQAEDENAALPSKHGSRSPDPVLLTFSELDAWANLPAGWMAGRLATRRPLPHPRPKMSREPWLDTLEPGDTTQQEQLACAAALFVVGLEHLRCVEGWISELLLQDAAAAVERPIQH